MGSVQQIRVKWNNHLTNFPKVFDNLLHKKDFVDVTLSCEGHSMKAHKLVLSACSPYFHNLFVENPCKHPIVIMRDFKYSEIEAVIEYMYKGEVNIAREGLREFLKTAQSLQVKGLADDNCDTNEESAEDDTRTNQIQQRNVPETNTAPELPRPPNISRSVELPSRNQDSFTQSNTNRDQFSQPTPKRMRIAEKGLAQPPRSPADHVSLPKSPQVPQQTLPFPAEIKAPPSPEETSSEAIEPSIKLEVKQYEDLRYEEEQEPMVDENQEEEAIGTESPEPDTIVLGDDPDIMDDDDEPEIMFAHDGSSQDAGIPQDNLESTLMSALSDSGASTSQQLGEGNAERHHKRGIKRSKLWSYFQEVPSDVAEVLCFVCGAVVVRSRQRKGSGPCRNENLTVHLRNNHPRQYEEYQVIKHTHKTVRQPWDFTNL